MQEKTWLQPLPNIEKELELITLCIDAIQTCAMVPKNPAISNVQLSAENILMRYLNQLDILTRPNESEIKIKI